MSTTTGARGPESEAAALGHYPNAAAECSSPENSQPGCKSGRSKSQGGRPATFLNPANVWGESDEGEPDGVALTYGNVALLLSNPDWSGFEVFDLISSQPGSCIRQEIGRFIRFRESPQIVPLEGDGGIYINHALRCAEICGGTLAFAYTDESAVDQELNFNNFRDWLRKAGVPEKRFDLGDVA